MEHLLLNLEAPLMAFGAESVDFLGPIAPFPGAAMLAGLLGSALGWRRGRDAARLQELQDRLVFAARIDREPWGHAPWTDLQTARLSLKERGWTTAGRPQGREKSSPATLESPHLRRRDYHPDLRVTAAFRLQPAAAEPTLDDLTQALVRPARPLFLGRKSCPPMTRLLLGTSQGETVLAALLQVPLETEKGRNAPTLRVQYPPGEGCSDLAPEQPEEVLLADRRDWRAGRHSGRQPYCRARLPRDCFAPAQPTEEDSIR